MTEKLYYQDAYQTEFIGTVQRVFRDGDQPVLVLDRTAFYPEGGGQPADHGTLVLPDGGRLSVLDVQEKDGEILHVVQAEGAGAEDVLQAVVPGMVLRGILDWDRRFDHMQQHSGEHIVSGMICRRFCCENVGFHLGEDTVTIDFNARIGLEQAEEIEGQANRYIWEDHPFEVLWPKSEELKALSYRSKKELEGDVRIARFPGADTCACCGTHVSGSAQVGLVKLLSAKNFHEGTRLELLCGQRAARFLSMNYRVNKAAAVLLSTSEENTARHVEKLLEENTRLKTELAAAEDRLLRLRAETYQGQGDVCIIEDTLDPAQARPLADLIADCCGGRAAVFVKDRDGYRYAVVHREKNITELIKNMNQALEGRGGGQNGFAQGAVKAEKQRIREYFRGIGLPLTGTD